MTANDHLGPERSKGDSAEDSGDKHSYLLEHPSCLQNVTGLQPCQGKPDDWNDVASC